MNIELQFLKGSWICMLGCVNMQVLSFTQTPLTLCQQLIGTHKSRKTCLSFRPLVECCQLIPDVKSDVGVFTLFSQAWVILFYQKECTVWFVPWESEKNIFEYCVAYTIEVVCGVLWSMFLLQYHGWQALHLLHIHEWPRLKG